MYNNAHKKIVKKHHVQIGQRSAKNGQLTIFFISDIHRRIVDEELLSNIKSPIDLVIIGGDLAERGVALERIERNIAMLSRLGPLFYVWGNNDREVGEQNIRVLMKRQHGRILENSSATVPNHPKWGIFGTEEMSSRNVNIEQTFREKNKFQYSILVCHQPNIISKVEMNYLPTIALAGHTHGGQIRVGKLGLLEKGSFVRSEGRATLISNGYGTSTLPFRLGADPESHIIAITYDDSL